MVFNLIDPRYEKVFPTNNNKDKFIMKELNTLDYLVSLLEYMIKKKINYQTKTVAEFLLAFAVLLHKYSSNKNIISKMMYQSK